MGDIATIRDVARHAEVSLGTVSNYLNGTKPLAPQTRKRIDEAIRVLQFVPNSGSRLMRGARSSAIGYVATDGADPFFVDVSRGIEDVARTEGLVIVSCNSDGSLEHERQYVRALAEMRVVGVIAVPVYAPHSHEHFEQLESSGASVIYLGTDAGESDACSISFDDTAGGFLAAQHLVKLGHRDIMFIGGPAGERQIRDRVAGARAALEEAGLDPSSLRRMDAEGSTVAARAAVGERLVALGDDRPRAIFCASDSLALAIEGVLLRAGLRVPDDVAIVGYNDIEQTEVAAVPITTVHVPRFEIGRTAARMLLREAEPGHRHERFVFQPTLVARASTLG